MKPAQPHSLTHTTAPSDPTPRRASEPDRVEGDELREDGEPDRVDQAGEASFPASDPPSRWAGKDEPPKLNGA